MSEPLKHATIGVECEMTNPPHPTCFAIKQDRKITALLSLGQVQLALEHYERLLRDFDKTRP